MLFYIVSVLFIWVLLANKLDAGSSENNLVPCTYSAKADAYEKFLKKHVVSKTLDQNQWQDFIKEIGTCDRQVQSFIPSGQEQEVDNVCSPSGGKAYSGDLCVSKQEFNFTTVFVDKNCTVNKVTPEEKYLILACNEIQGHCRPVHFEPNPNNTGPENKNPDCRNPYSPNQAHFAHLNLGLLILTLLSTA